MIPSWVRVFTASRMALDQLLLAIELPKIPQVGPKTGLTSRTKLAFLAREPVRTPPGHATLCCREHALHVSGKFRG